MGRSQAFSISSARGTMSIVGKEGEYETAGILHRMALRRDRADGASHRLVRSDDLSPRRLYGRDAARTISDAATRPNREGLSVRSRKSDGSGCLCGSLSSGMRSAIRGTHSERARARLGRVAPEV